MIKISIKTSDRPIYHNRVIKTRSKGDLFLIQSTIGDNKPNIMEYKIRVDENHTFYYSKQDIERGLEQGYWILEKDI